MNITNTILEMIQKKYTLEENIDLENFNYIESGYIDSLGIIQFIAEIEDTFQIEFSDAELSSPSFKVVGTLIKLIENKRNNLEAR